MIIKDFSQTHLTNTTHCWMEAMFSEINVQFFSLFLLFFFLSLVFTQPGLEARCIQTSHNVILSEADLEGLLAWVLRMRGSSWKKGETLREKTKGYKSTNITLGHSECWIWFTWHIKTKRGVGKAGPKCSDAGRESHQKTYQEMHFNNWAGPRHRNWWSKTKPILHLFWFN